MPQDTIPEDTFPSDEDFDDEDEEDSESSSDVDAKLLDEEVFDDEFFECYSALRKKDDKIYDEKVRFFSKDHTEEQDDIQETLLPSSSKKSSAPKMSLLDYHLNVDIDVDDSKPNVTKPASKSYYEQELEDIKESFKKVSENIDSDSDDELLVVRGSTEGSKPRRAINSLLDKIEDDEDEQLKHLKEIWSDSSKLSKDEKFLRDYILNKRYLPPNDDGDHEDAGKGRDAFFSKNIDELSDIDDDDQKSETTDSKQLHLHSEDKNFDKLARIPRNSTKTIRDMVEKQQKKEKRKKETEKAKKKKIALKDADCEDVVGDLPTKFHYRATEPNDYGLSAEELLMATDEELEKWISLRDTIAYKTPEEELAQKELYERKRDDHELKKKILKSIYGDGPSEPQDSEKLQSGKRVRKKRIAKSANESADVDSTETREPELEAAEDATSSSKRKKKHKRGLNHKKFLKTNVAPDRLLSYGLSKTKLKKSKLL